MHAFEISGRAKSWDAFTRSKRIGYLLQPTKTNSEGIRLTSPVSKAYFLVAMTTVSIILTLNICYDAALFIKC